MEKLKVIYFIAVTICAIELLQFIFGANGIFYLIRDAIAIPAEEPQKFSISAHYTADSNNIKFYKLLSKVNTTGYFLSLLGTCLSLLLNKLDKNTKYIIGIGFFMASLIFSLITAPVWRHIIEINYL